MYKTNRNILENLCILRVEYARKSVYNKDKIRHRNTKQQEENNMKFTIEKVANMIFIVSDCNTIFNAWDEREFTERKLKNAMNRISKNLNGNAEFKKTF